ncbi:MULTISPECIES: hypothetical protein [unclassified Methylocaldum]|uniref:hypothetical protein n=1 Tax=unclassified Methylocaldum TaxID=2622260 RepID=UPI000A327059|nr:hypothetical protein [Methylocaldum sp. RMAD-M]MBP1151278.1 hypothetical protein [Methylocaldum sp. RMAD-M]
MERLFLRGAILIGLSLANAGCAMFGRFHPVDFYERDPKYSLALQIALATGLTSPNVYTGKPEPLNDVPRAQLAAALKGTDSGAAGRELLHAAGLATGVRKLTGAGIAPPGFSLAGAGAMSILSVLTSAPRKHPVLENHIWVWMPASEALNQEAAAAKLSALLFDTYMKTLPEPYRFVRTETERYPGLISDTVETNHVIEGGECDGQRQRCYTRPLKLESLRPLSKSPEWIGGKAAYFVEAFAGAWLFHPLRDVHDKPEERIAIGKAPHLQRMSAALPDWVYIYSAPTNERPYPVIFHRGETLYFIEPENQSKNQAN